MFTMQKIGEEEDEEKKATFIKQHEEVVQQDSTHVLHALCLPARERHLQSDTSSSLK